MTAFIDIVDGLAQVQGIFDNASSQALFNTRSIGSFVADVTIEEDHQDELTITDHPVETGASITDHAFKNPAMLNLVAGWWNGSEASTGTTYVNDMYAAFLALQESREPIDVSTGKRNYSNMLIRSLAVTTDEVTANTLLLRIGLREIIMVDTSFVNAPDPAVQSDPASTSAGSTSGVRQPSVDNSPPSLTADQIFGTQS